METFNPLDTSCEPMDVDLSTTSANMSVTEPSFGTSLNTTKSEPEVWNIKKYHIVRDKTKISKYNIKHWIIVHLILFSSIAMYAFLSIKCCYSLDLEELKIKLNNRLYGQPEGIDSLIKSLNENVQTKLLFIYGGTGVGKTFSISLALENYWNSTNVYHYTMPTFVNTFSTETMFGINICDSSIVVVDDLQQNDFNVKEQIETLIKKSEDLNKQLTVILIYNCDVVTSNFVKACDDTFYMKLTKVYDDIKVHKSFIRFKPLTQKELKMCIQDQLSGRKENIDIDNILSNFNVALDGCKGVYKKINFLNIV